MPSAFEMLKEDQGELLTAAMVSAWFCLYALAAAGLRWGQR